MPFQDWDQQSQVLLLDEESLEKWDVVPMD